MAENTMFYLSITQPVCQFKRGGGGYMHNRELEKTFIFGQSVWNHFPPYPYWSFHFPHFCVSQRCSMAPAPKARRKEGTDFTPPHARLCA